MSARDTSTNEDNVAIARVIACVICVVILAALFTGIVKGSYAYTIAFNDGHDTGIFSFDLLRQLGERLSEHGSTYQRTLYHGASPNECCFSHEGPFVLIACHGGHNAARY